MKTYFKYKNDIQGFEDVSGTIKATEKIASASIHSLKLEVGQLNDYMSELERMLSRVSEFYFNAKEPLFEKRNSGGKAMILITGDKGLVGGMYHNLANFLIDKINNEDIIITIGKKGRKYLEEEGVVVDRSFFDMSGAPSEESVSSITDYVFKIFETRNIAQVDIIYPRFIALSAQEPTSLTFLPFEFKDELGTDGKIIDIEVEPGFPIFEQAKKEISADLVKKYISLFFHRIMLESKLSEYSARMVAMENASVKTEELIKKLSLRYFKAKKKFITKTQIESFIVHKII